MIKWNEYTWYSKLAAAIFFLGVFPALTFYIGIKYQETKIAIESKVEVDNTVAVTQQKIENVLSAETNIGEGEITSELVPLKAKGVLAQGLVDGVNTINGLTFNKTIVNEIKPTFTFSQSDLVYEKRFKYEDFIFRMIDTKIEILRDLFPLESVSSHNWSIAMSGTILNPLVFRYADRDYFVFDGEYCGNGGCMDENILFSFKKAGRSFKTESIWLHGWGWGHGGVEPSGFQGTEKLDFVIEYKGNLYLFPNSDASVIVVNSEGDVIKKIDQNGLTLTQILTK